MDFAVDFPMECIPRDIDGTQFVLPQGFSVAIVPVSALEKDVLMVAVSPTMITIVSLPSLRH